MLTWDQNRILWVLGDSGEKLDKDLRSRPGWGGEARGHQRQASPIFQGWPYTEAKQTLL